MKCKVSIAMITYNHERFVREALESILSQKTDFSYEVIIGEDCSPDGTRKILEEYETKYPNIIKPIYREHNLGVLGNVLDVLQRCEGEYIAFLEGDDFWTDPHKLQKQVDFLEQNSEYVMVTHECSMVDIEGVQEEEICWVHEPGTSEYILKNVEHFELPGQTNTMMIRNKQDVLEGFRIKNKKNKLIPLDRLLPIVMLAKGKIKILPDVMSAYRFYIEENGTNWTSNYDKRSDKCNYLVHYWLMKNMEECGKSENLHIDMSNEKIKLFFETWHRFKEKKKIRFVLQCLVMLGGEFPKKTFFDILKRNYLG